MTILFFLFFAIESLFSAYKLSQIPTGGNGEAEFSVERLALLGILFCLALGSFLVFLILRVNERHQERFARFCSTRQRRLLQSTLAVGTLCLFILLLPDYRFQRFAAYFQRLRPFFLLGFMGGTTAWLLLQYQFGALKAWFASLRKMIPGQRATLIPLGIFLLCWLFVRVSGWGITSGTEAWYANAVPLKSQQIFLLILFLILIYRFINKRNPALLQKRTLMFFGIWALAALCWSLAPMERHFFAPGPYLPNLEFYPYSDAILYNVPAQTALDGLGFGFNGLVLKPMVTFVSFIGTWLSGGQTNLQLMLQSALYGILPAILYLLGTELCGRFAGLLAAGMMILQEWNALHTQQILTIHSRLEMAEFLSGIILAAFSLFLFRWFKGSTNTGAYRWAAAAGGMLALGIYTRYNLFSLIPAVILFAALVFRRQKRLFFRTTCIFLLSLLVSAGPWLYRSYQISGDFLPEIFGALKVVVVDQRLKPILEEESALTTGSEVINQTIGEKNAMGTLTPAEKWQSDPDTAIAFMAARETRPVAEELRLQIHPLIDTLGNHFFHNIVAMAFVMPVQLTFDDLDHIYTRENSVWQDGWQGELTWGQRILLLINLLIVSAAIVAIWKQFGLPGITFLFIVITYAASLGLARTSGGRYLVPMNWGLILLYACGLNLVLRQLFKKTLLQEENTTALSYAPTEAPAGTPADRQNVPFLKGLLAAVPVMACFFLFLLSMLIAEKAIPNQLTAYSNQEILQMLRENLEIEPDWQLIEDQVASGKMAVYQGRALYPRFYYFNTGEHGTDKAYQYKNYSRLVLKLLGQDRMLDLVMPIGASPDIFPNNADVIALACNETHFIDVLAVSGVGRNGETFTYVRDPLPDFSCPLPEPVCTQVDQCY